MMKNLKSKIIVLLISIIIFGCSNEYSPKPKGYFRIDFPEKIYTTYQGDCPFSFEYPQKSFLENKTRGIQKPCWYNLHYPQYANTIHMSYFAITKDSLPNYIEETRMLAMKHIVKANQINEEIFRNPANNVYGLIYDFGGETATNFQFFLTDSTNHFFRGAMYFNMPPNSDSLQPVEQFIKQDLRHFIETFRLVN